MSAAQTQTRDFSLEGAVETLRRKWRRGCYNDFDSLLMQILGCSRETAERIRETMEDLELLAYDSNGLLVWYARGLGRLAE